MPGLQVLNSNVWGHQQTSEALACSSQRDFSSLCCKGVSHCRRFPRCLGPFWNRHSHECMHYSRTYLCQHRYWMRVRWNLNFPDRTFFRLWGLFMMTKSFSSTSDFSWVCQGQLSHSYTDDRSSWHFHSWCLGGLRSRWRDLSWGGPMSAWWAWSWSSH